MDVQAVPVAATTVNGVVIHASVPSQFQINVLSPTVRGSGVSKYTEYTIRTQVHFFPLV